MDFQVLVIIKMFNQVTSQVSLTSQSLTFDSEPDAERAIKAINEGADDYDCTVIRLYK